MSFAGRQENTAPHAKTRLILFIALLGILSVIRVCIAYAEPYTMRTDMMHDSALQVTQAISITDHMWLGIYNDRTLIKGITYPVFMALLHMLHIPYGVGYGLLIVISCLLFAYALRPVIRNVYVEGLLYLFLLYNPLGYSTIISQDLYRNALAGWAALMVFAGIIGLFVRRDSSMRIMLFWSIFAGLALCFFWFLREDSIWALPFVLLAILVTFIMWVVRIRRQKLYQYVLLAVLPFAMLIACKAAISAENSHAYGIFAANERSDTHFSDFMSEIYHIDDGRKTYVTDGVEEWVSRETMEMAVEASPSLYSIRDEIYSRWDSWADADGNGVLEGDIIQWALRDAVQDAGYYSDPKQADAFYEKAAQELQEAFADGRLKEREGLYLSSQIRPLYWSDFRTAISNAPGICRNILSYYLCDMGTTSVSGQEGDIETWEAFTGEDALRGEDYLNSIGADDLLREKDQATARRAESVSSIVNTVTRAYRLIAVFGVIFMLCGWIICLYKMIRRKQEAVWMEMWLIMTGLLLSALLDVFITALFSHWLCPTVETYYYYYYAPSAYLLTGACEFIGMIATVRSLRMSIEHHRSGQ